MPASTVRKRKLSAWAALGNRLLEFLSRRAALLLFSGILLALGFLAWNLVMAVVGYRPQSHLAGVEQVVDGKFRGIAVEDRTRDRFLNNVWLRTALSDGLRTAHVFRRHQVGRIFLCETRHPQTRAPAVLVLLQPAAHNQPLPAFEPVYVRRWQPPPGVACDLQTLAQRQSGFSPDEEDLLQLRQMISAGRYQDFQSLVTSVRRGLLFVIFGAVAIIAAGVYRCRAYLTTRWDPLAEAQHDHVALRSMQAARQERYERQQLDLGP